MLEVLNAHYRKLERLYQPVRDPNYEHLVIAADNTDESVHRWFRMKEAFSTRLFVRLLKDLQLNDNEFLRILDPFTGSGTTLVSALTWAGENERQVYAHGTEVNPFLHLLSSAKVEALSLEPDLRSDLARSVERSAVAVLAHTDPIGKPPDLAAFHDTRYFDPSAVERLLRLRAGIDRLPNDLTAKILRVALAAVVEPASQLRRDGRALRYVPSKTVMEPRAAFARTVGRIALDLRLSVSSGHATAELRDALRPESAVASRTYDLAIFSPPYPNNIDYTEVYKLEAWLLGLIANQDEFRAQRFRTMRSHPSISWPVQQDCLPARLREQVLFLANPLLEAVPADRYARGRRDVILGYLEDSARLFQILHPSIIDGGYAVYIVGNSHHGSGDGSLTVAADILLAAIAEACGFDVVSVKEARRLKRRGQDALLRESVVVLRKTS